MNSFQRDVINFHRLIGAPVSSFPNVAKSRMPLRERLVKEESQELVEAIQRGDVAQIAQEAIDLLYVTIGLLVECGVDAQPVWDAVHLANMRKIGDPSGGKARKPEGWTAPDVAEILLRQSS